MMWTRARTTSKPTQKFSSIQSPMRCRAKLRNVHRCEIKCEQMLQLWTYLLAPSIFNLRYFGSVLMQSGYSNENSSNLLILPRILHGPSPHPFHPLIMAAQKLLDTESLRIFHYVLDRNSMCCHHYGRSYHELFFGQQEAMSWSSRGWIALSISEWSVLWNSKKQIMVPFPISKFVLPALALTNSNI
jgi:hypothetical protein